MTFWFERAQEKISMSVALILPIFAQWQMSHPRFSRRLNHSRLRFMSMTIFTPLHRLRGRKRIEDRHRYRLVPNSCQLAKI